MRRMRALYVLGAVALAGSLSLLNATAEAHGDDAKASLEGRVVKVTGTCPNLRFVIGETEIITDERTRFEDGVCADVVVGRRVEAKGKLSANGKLSAWKVDLDD